jgi:L-lactate dehydrogenase complex protein LldE
MQVRYINSIEVLAEFLMKVSLFIPCLVDQFFPQVGMNLYKILKKAGATVDYPVEQTCCGQPAFNSGYHSEAIELAQRFLEVFRHADYIVAPSGSCTSMVKVFYPEILDAPMLQEALHEVTSKTYEFSEFLVNVMGITDVGARFPHRITYHDACHLLRELHVKDPPRTLIRNVRDLEFVELADSENCCGFGGTFSVKYPEISTAMAEDKAAAIAQSGAEYIVANDSSCLMQIAGYLSRKGIAAKPLHLVDLLGGSLS